MIFRYENLPISDNKLYASNIGQARRYLTTEASTYKTYIVEHTKAQIKEQDRLKHDYTNKIKALKNKLLIVNILLAGDWFTLSGSIRKKDAQNYTKALLDSMFEAFKKLEPGLDDSQIFHITITKLNEDDEHTEIRIEELKDDNKE
jgi:Holliday junction resolvase RusA-like endonuclease